MIPEDRLFTGKDLTFPIEATNGDIGHRLARFIRRTKASSRSHDMVLASLKITHHLQADDVLSSYIKPLLSILS